MRRRVIGAALTIVGVALVVTGIVLMIKTRRKHGRPDVKGLA
ncbi:MAG: hypothetical protein ACTHJW_19870 [Streptosporangiaceae bacterium]